MATWTTIVLLGALLLLLAVRFRPVRRISNKPPPKSATFRGVEVRFDEPNCCQWVKKLAGARLLPHQARLFPLPLPECDAARCTCRYEHFSDRRMEDRRMPFATLYTAFGRSMADERRSGVERRKGYISQEVRIITEAEIGFDSGGRPSV